MVKFQQLFLTVSMILVLFLSSCASFTPAGNGELAPLRIAWNPWAGDYPLVLAKELGLFDQYGVEVEPIYSEDYSQLLIQLLAGEIDGFNASISDVLLMSITDEVQIVLVADYPEGANTIVADASIQTPADLKGKRLGVDASIISSRLLVSEMFKAYGLEAGEVTMVSTNPEAVPDALGKTIDAGFTWDPYTTQAQEAGYHVIFSDSQAPGLLTDALVFRKSTIDERPGDIQAVVAAWLEASRFMNDHPDEAIDLILNYSGLPREMVSLAGIKVYSYEDNQVAFQFRDDFSSLYHVITVSQNFLRDEGYISKSVPLEQLVRANFVENLPIQ